MTNPERANYLYLYDLPKQSTNSNQIALIIKDKTGYVLDIKPQIRRELNRPFCTAIVNITDNEAFQKACAALRYFEYDNKMCRGLPFDNSLHGANQQRLIDHNVFISKIPKDDTHSSKWLDEFCSKFGDIKSLKISLSADHSSRGYGFVCFQDPASATACLEQCGGKDEVCAIKYQPRDKREFRRVFNNIYVKNLPEDFNEEKTRELFSQFGRIGMIKFQKIEIGAFAMIAYFPEDKDDREAGPKAAAAAVDEMNGKEVNGKKLYVKAFLNKTEREQEIQRDAMKYKNSKKKCNLFVKNIPDSVQEKDIRDLFGKFGEIESVRLFPKEKGKNPYCFVCYQRPDNAQKAKEELQNSDFMGRSLQINHYEIKEIRKLQNEENQDKIDFMKFRQQHGGPQAGPGAQRPEVLIEMLKKLFSQFAPNQNRTGGRPPHGAPYPMQNQGQRPQNMGGKQYGNNRDGRSQGRGQNMPIAGQKPGMPMGGQPQGQMPQQQVPGGMQGKQMMGGPGPQNFPLPMQPAQPTAQPGNVKEAYLMRCTPLVPGVTPQNPFYKNQVGTAIFGFVEQLKGTKAPKITGMLIDLNISEIHQILQSYEHFQMRVDQADTLIAEQMQAPAQQQ